MSRIYTNITIEIFVKVNIYPPPPPLSNKVGNDLDLAPSPPPLPGLQNDNDLQYSEDTNLESTESSDLLLRSADYVGRPFLFLFCFLFLLFFLSFFLIFLYSRFSPTVSPSFLNRSLSNLACCI